MTGGTKIKIRAEKLRHLLFSGEPSRLIVVGTILDGIVIKM